MAFKTDTDKDGWLHENGIFHKDNMWLVQINPVRWFVSGIHQSYNAYGPYKTEQEAKLAAETLMGQGLLYD